jgi:EAL domain-containing protein (putative c-di-GMP-specific phosphodiesterase class I)
MADAPAGRRRHRSPARPPIRLAIDHFGTGPSSLSYLDRLPIHYAKIDQSFTRRATTPGGALVLSALADMGTALNVTPIGQGIRTADEPAVCTVALAGVGCASASPVARPTLPRAPPPPMSSGQ